MEEESNARRTYRAVNSSIAHKNVPAKTKKTTQYMEQPPGPGFPRAVCLG